MSGFPPIDPPPRRSSLARHLSVLSAVASLAATAAVASTLELAVGDVVGDGWQARGITLALQLKETGLPSATVRVETLSLPAPVGDIQGIEARCPSLELGTTIVRCQSLALAGSGRLRRLPKLTGPVEYRRAGGGLRWQIATGGDTAESGGTLTLAGELKDADLRATIAAQELEIEPWVELMRDLLAGSDTASEEVSEAAGDSALTGRLTGELRIELPGDAPARASLEGRFEGLSGYNASGTRAVEALGLGFSGGWRDEGDAGLFEGQVAVATGEIYQEPVYADLGAFPAEIAFGGVVRDGSVLIESFGLTQAGVVEGSGRARLESNAGAGWALAEARVELTELTLPGAYQVLMQPFLADTDLGDLETLGSARGELTIVDGAIDTAALSLDEVFLDDRSGRLALYGLYGDLAWGEGASDEPLRLLWDGGYLYGFSFGSADLAFVRRNDGIALSEPVSIPVFDGALEVNVLELGGSNMNDASAAFDARLSPVDMRAVAHALDWPPLAGTLSGEIPRLSYRDGELTFGGEFRADMFDGQVTIRNFNVRDPFQDGARLRADVDLKQLDLRQVTEAFSFGLITGRLDGYVRELRMIDWAPVGFDARLFTSPENKGRRRISQRAVDNIANIGGGGGAAALSSGFLRFFEDFAYDRIELGCRLTLDLCEMTGIRPEGQGYLILKGRGLPRITVVGYAREVSWPTMVAQLEAILTSEGPVIE